MDGVAAGGAGGAHAHTVWVVCCQEWVCRAVLQQGRQNKHRVPPAVNNFSNSLQGQSYTVNMKYTNTLVTILHTVNMQCTHFNMPSKPLPAHTEGINHRAKHGQSCTVTVRPSHRIVH